MLSQENYFGFFQYIVLGLLHNLGIVLNKNTSRPT